MVMAKLVKKNSFCVCEPRRNQLIPSFWEKCNIKWTVSSIKRNWRKSLRRWTPMKRISWEWFWKNKMISRQVKPNKISPEVESQREKTRRWIRLYWKAFTVIFGTSLCIYLIRRRLIIRIKAWWSRWLNSWRKLKSVAKLKIEKLFKCIKRSCALSSGIVQK